MAGDIYGNLGRALIDLWRGGVKSSYSAKGWHAQISQITAVKAGADAANAAGLDVSKKTLLAWLADEQEPNEKNKGLIRRAYMILSGRVWDPAFERRQYRIDGIIDAGDGPRERPRTLVIEGSSGRWERLRDLMSQWDDPDPEEVEEAFIDDVIVEDIGDGTGDGWSFPGPSYTV